MQVFHADQHVVPSFPSIFLAGPTPRSPQMRSWRPEAIDILQNLGFPGMVLIPERRDWSPGFDYLEQAEWELIGLERCTVLAFWVPRELTTLPGFTTNVEFGRYVGSGRCVYGRPDGAPHTRYLDWLYHKVTGRQPAATLAATLQAAVERAHDPGPTP